MFLLTALALRLWRQRRTAAAAWLAAAFGALATAVLVGQVVPDDAPFALDVVSTAVAVIGVLAFPYLLFRFAASFGDVPVILRRMADVAAATIIVVAVALVPAFAPPDVEPAWFPALLFTILGYWTALSAWVAVRLWRAGAGRPTVARRRMRVLAVGSALVNLALFVSIIGPAESAVAAVVARSIAIVAAGGFYLAFSPPGPLRREWRREEERTLRGAPLDVLRADTHAEAVETVLPRVAQLFGTGQAVFCDAERRPIATFGADDVGDVEAALDEAQAPHTVEQHEDWVLLRLGTGWVGVRTDPYAPFFGADEQVRVAGDRIITQSGARVADRVITTLNEAAAFVLADSPDVQWASSLDVPAPGQLDEPLTVDADAAGFLGDWYGFAYSVLEELRADVASTAASRVQLWPEHFDAAFECLDGDRRAVFGASPGDRHVNEPYLYVLPTVPAAVTPGGFWDADGFFGSVLPLSRFVDAADQRRAALHFLTRGRDLLLT